VVPILVGRPPFLPDCAVASADRGAVPRALSSAPLFAPPHAQRERSGFDLDRSGFSVAVEQGIDGAVMASGFQQYHVGCNSGRGGGLSPRLRRSFCRDLLRCSPVPPKNCGAVVTIWATRRSAVRRHAPPEGIGDDFSFHRSPRQHPRRWAWLCRLLERGSQRATTQRGWRRSP
jgi:hypothetical protein